MTDLEGYKSWLTSLQRDQRSFTNNYWCAVLARDMEESKLSDSFKIPYFIVEEELLKEDNNVNLANSADQKISTALQLWLVHLLKADGSEVNISNYEEVLRSFFEMDSVLPARVARPLTPSTSFHCLPTECKLWIFYTLRNHGKAVKSLKTLAKDPLGNCYTIVPHSRLYVYSATRSECNLHLIDDETLCAEPWGSLYRFVNAHPCQLLCEDANGWDTVWKMLLKFKLNNLYHAINREIVLTLTEKSSVLMMRDSQRKEFEEFLSKLTPVPRARTAKEAIITEESHKNEAIPGVNTLQADLKVLSVAEAAPQKSASHRCWDFPGCPLNDKCRYRHPNVRCNKFPNCPFGWKCTYLHDFCPNDGICVETNCAYEHLVSQRTFYRAPRGTEDEKSRPVASVQPLPSVTKAISDHEYSIDKKPRDSADPKNSRGPEKRLDEKAKTEEKKRRCKWFPQCRNETTCKYWHPKQSCRNFPSGKGCPGKWCLFEHPTCSDDGACEDAKCAYEHLKSTPVLSRKQAGKKNTGSLSRATSVSNLSTCSARSRARSISRQDNSDYESARSSPVNEKPDIPKKYCNFLRFCTKKATCKYQHPHEKCPKFPCCPNGALCPFLHEVCPNDGVCCKDDCAYEHNKPHRIGLRWCTYKSQCRTPGCTFIHPKTCTAPCPTPGDCWMYHPPAPPPPPFAGPGFPGPHPGFGLPHPQFMGPPPDAIRYGFGPDSVYRVPGSGCPPGPVPMQAGYPPTGPGFPSHGAAGHYPNRPATPGPPVPPRPNPDKNEKRTRGN